MKSSEVEGLPLKGHFVVPAKDRSAVFLSEDGVISEATFTPPVADRPVNTEANTQLSEGDNSAIFEQLPPPDAELARAMGVDHTELHQENRLVLQEVEQRKRQEMEELTQVGPSVRPPPAHRAPSIAKLSPYRTPQPQPGHGFEYQQRSDLEVGSAVRLANNESKTGVIRWIGTFPGMQVAIAGIELVSYYIWCHQCIISSIQDEPMESCKDGEWGGHHYFTCPYGRGFFCPLTNLKPATQLSQHLGGHGAMTANSKGVHKLYSYAVEWLYLSIQHWCTLQAGAKPGQLRSWPLEKLSMKQGY